MKSDRSWIIVKKKKKKKKKNKKGNKGTHVLENGPRAYIVTSDMVLSLGL